jgi:spore photoproduct lyase
MKIVYQETNNVLTKINNNSSDFISPNFIYNCALNCEYCYVHRYNRDTVYVNTNQKEILDNIIRQVKMTDLDKPNQQDPKYPVVDIGCNTDWSIYQKIVEKNCDYSLFDIQNTLSEAGIKSSFATKYPSMFTTSVKEIKVKPRIRVSVMPQMFSDILEPGMQDVSLRIKDINRLKELGYEVHINYSPVICNEYWIDEYTQLFAEIKEKAGENYCEVIFLTNHKNQMHNASELAQLLMSPSNETKNNRGIMRYPIEEKRKLVSDFKTVYSAFFDPKTIRYIF